MTKKDLFNYLFILVLVAGCSGGSPPASTLTAQKPPATPSPPTVVPSPLPTQTALEELLGQFADGATQIPTRTPDSGLEVNSTVLEGHTDGIIKATWSPDGELLASASEDGTVRLWSPLGKALAVLKGHTSWVTSLDWSPDSSLLASGSVDGSVRLWKKDGSLAGIIPVNAGTVYGLDWSPDGKVIATGSVFSPTQSTVELWSPDGQLLGKTSTKYNGGKFYNLAWSPDGEYLLGGAIDYALWDKNGKLVFAIPKCAHCTPVWGIAWAPNSHRFAIGNENGTVDVYSVDSDKLWTGQAYCCVDTLAWSSDGRYLAGTNKIWRSDGSEVASLLGQPSALAWSSDNLWLAGATQGNLVRIWDASGKQMAALLGHTDWINSLEWSPDGDAFATSSSDGTVIIWKLQGH